MDLLPAFFEQQSCELHIGSCQLTRKQTSLSVFESSRSGNLRQILGSCQVASQEGTYLAKALNHMAKKNIVPEGPMRIRGEGRHLCHPFR
jgi:hypothetical protein